MKRAKTNSPMESCPGADCGTLVLLLGGAGEYRQEEEEEEWGAAGVGGGAGGREVDFKASACWGDSGGLSGYLPICMLVSSSHVWKNFITRKNCSIESRVLQLLLLPLLLLVDGRVVVEEEEALVGVEKKVLPSSSLPLPVDNGAP